MIFFYYMYMLRPNLESIPIRILLDWDSHPNLEFIA
jgi:hypothetical protein